MRFRLRYWIRLFSAIVARFKVIVFGGVVFGLFVFVLASFLLPRLNSKVTYIGMAGRFHTEDLPISVLGQIGDGLTRTAKDGTAEPALAERWEEAAEGREWTFYLKKGREWHDGTPVTSDTIQYSFEDTRIERPDEYTIKFVLESPFSPFPSIVSRPTFKRGLLGTGEWRVENIRLNGTYVQELVLVGKTGEKKVYRFYPSEDSAKVAYQLGHVDILYDIVDPSPLDEWRNTQTAKTVRRDRVVALFFNNESEVFKGPKNKPIRQALSYAIDKESFGSPRALGPISPDSWAYNPLVKDYSYDIERARELLGNLSSISVSLSTSPILLHVAEAISKQWGELGIKTDIHVVSSVPEDYDAFLAIYDVPYDPDQYAVWHTTQKFTNISHYSNPRIDRLLEEGRVETDLAERKKIYLDFQRFLLEDAPVAFLYHPVSYTITRK